MDVSLEKLDVKVDEDAASFLARHANLSKSRIKDAMTKGAVWLHNGRGRKRLRRASTMLRKGDSIDLYYSESILKTEAASPELIDDKQSFSVWNKPVGLMSGGTRFGDHCAINRVVEKQLDRPTFLVHRLDRFVWGLMLLAHSKRAAAKLSRQFQDRETEKVYQAIVEGTLTGEVIIDKPLDCREAKSIVTPIETNNNRTLVQVRIESGRKHQIRRHLVMIGHPIIGDRQYGETNKQGIQLASVTLGFNTPEGQAVKYQLPEQLTPQL